MFPLSMQFLHGVLERCQTNGSNGTMEDRYSIWHGRGGGRRSTKALSPILKLKYWEDAGRGERFYYRNRTNNIIIWEDANAHMHNLRLAFFVVLHGAVSFTKNRHYLIRKQVTPTIWTRVLARGRAAPAEPMFIPLRIFNSLRLAGSEGAGHATPWNTRCYCQK
ncbi:unnamed protein product, partial [Nesidiocoris tenuis]